MIFSELFPCIHIGETPCAWEFRFLCFRCGGDVCLNHVCTPDFSIELRFVALWERARTATEPIRLLPDMLCIQCFRALYPALLLDGVMPQPELPESETSEKQTNAFAREVIYA